MSLKPLTQTCTPRADVLAGQFAAADFAARLEQVVSDPAGYADYGDPGRFFALTYPTGGMKRLLTGVFGRLSDQDVPGAENPVVRFQTSFGGGKTHGLIAAYHVAKGFRPAAEFFDDGFDVNQLPSDMRVAALVGEQIDPVNGVDINGVTAYTLWGAIGAQLGPDAWAEVEKSDEERTPPGTGTIKKMLAGKPTVIIVDLCRPRNYADSGRARRHVEPVGVERGATRAAAVVGIVPVATPSTLSGRAPRREEGWHVGDEAEARSDGSAHRRVPSVVGDVGLHARDGAQHAQGGGAPRPLDGRGWR